MCTVISENRPTLEISPSPIFEQSCCAKGAFLSKVRPPIYATIHAVMFKKHWKSSSMQEEGLASEGRHHDKKGITESEISQLSKIRPPPSLRSHLSSSPMGIFSRAVVLRLLEQCVCIWSMYTVKDLFGNQVVLEKSQTCDVCLGSVLPVFWYGRSYRCTCSKFQLNGY